MDVVLLERIDTLGAMGAVVSVKPGYARNYLIPQGKALRASKQNVARFEAEFPIGLPEEIGLRGGLFYDIGNLWNLDNVDTAGATIVGAGGSFRHVIGFSLLWTTGFGPLRFNFSNALRKEAFDKEQSFDLTLQARF